MKNNTLNKNKKENIKKNILLNSSGSIFYCMCQWLITIVVIRISSYTDGGYLSLAMTTSSSFSAISLFSMRNYQISDVTGEYSDNEYVGSRIFTCFTALVCCSVYALVSSSLYQAMCIIAFMIVRVAEGMVDVLHGVDQKNDRYDYIFVSYILRGIATISAFCLCLKLTGDLQITLFVIAFLNLLVAIVFDYNKTNTLKKLKPDIISTRIISLLKKCIPIVIYAFLLSTENLIPKTVLQDNFGTKALGIYSSVASPTLIVQVFAMVVFNPLVPGFAKLFNENKYTELKMKLNRIYAAIIILIAVILAGAHLFGRPGLKILFGEDILQYYNIFMPVVWCTVTLAIVWILDAMVTALRKIRFLLVGIIIDFIICLAIVNPCVMTFGKNGVSYTQIISYSLLIIYLAIVCETTIRRPPK